jgi:TolB-like protein
VDLSEKHDQEYFSDGLTEQVLDLLAQLPGLRVIARTSAFSFRGKSDDIATIAKQLSVANILEGSVRKSGNRLRVTTHLIRAATGEELWSQTYDRELKDVFQVQDEIAAAVIGALKLKLAQGHAAFSTRVTSSTDAYNEYLLARKFAQGASLDASKRAINAYRKAIELDPGYAAAYAGLSLSESVIWSFGGDAVAMREAVAAAEKAVALGPYEADGYFARGQIRYLVSWDWTGAQADLSRALSYDPGSGIAQRIYGELLLALGRVPQAIAVLEHAIQSDPLSAQTWKTLGYARTVAGQSAAAQSAIRRALEIQPESLYIRYTFAELELLDGRGSQALDAFRTIDSPALRLTGIAVAEHSLGHAPESQQALDELELIAKRDNATYQLAEVHAWRGEKEQAFEWLEEAYRQRDSGVALIKTDPLLASLHGDARFSAMLARIHLP